MSGRPSHPKFDHASPGALWEQPFDDVLVVVSGRSAGRKAFLDRGRLHVGRGADAAGLTLDDPSVSRAHAELRRTEHGIVVVDLGSTHGTFCEDERLLPNVEVPLRPLALLRFGDVRARFVRGPVEELDPETGLPRGAGFAVVCARLLTRHRAEERATRVLGLVVPGLTSLRERHGARVERTAREELIQALRSRIPSLEALGHAEGLDLVGVGADAREAAWHDAATWSVPDALADGMRIATLDVLPDEPATSVLARLRSACGPDGGAVEASAPALRAFVESASRAPVAPFVLALEVESSGHDGPPVPGSHPLDAVANIVSALLEPDETLVRASPSLVLASLRGDVPHRAHGISSRLRQALASSLGPRAHALGVAVLPPAAWVGAKPDALVQRALARLGERRTPTGAALGPRLPFPLLGVAPHADGLENGSERALTLAHALEVAVRFLSFVLVSALGDPRLAHTRPRLEAALLPFAREPRRALPLGSWQTLLTVLADALAGTDEATSTQVALARSLSTSGALAACRPVIERRNALVHGALLTERMDRDDEAELRAALEGLARACAPLADLTCIAVTRIDDVGEPGDEFEYGVRLLQGASEVFPARTLRSHARLRRGWVYLVAPGDEPPIALHPHVVLAACDVCDRTEVFLATRLCFGEPGSELEVRGAVSSHRGRAVVPTTAVAEALSALRTAAHPRSG